MTDAPEIAGGGPQHSAVLPPFAHLAAEMTRRRRHGEPAGARAVLALYPELADDTDLLTDLACEEFSQRSAAGEALAVEEFAGGFPECAPGLVDLLITRQFFDENPELLGDPADGLAWPAAGEMLHGFALLREIGRGSFARVFLASEPDVGDRRVVVKVSFLDGAAEAEALGTLRHPNIVPVHSVRFEGDPGWSAVCMPYCGTATLAHVRERAFAGGRPRRAAEILDAARDATADDPPDGADGPSGFPTAAGYADGILHLGARLADALALVHARGLCHRDLKPANVLVTPDGRPMLIDFNLSCGAGAAGGAGGTLPYMAPEQLRALLPGGTAGETAVDARTDLFALGVLLHELLTGEHPFGPFPPELPRREQARRLLRRQRAGAAPLRRAAATVSPAVERLVGRCLAFDPAARPVSAAEVARGLRPRAGRPRWRGWGKAGLAAAALFVAAALAWGAVRPRPAPDDLFREAAAAYAEGRDGDALEHLNRLVEVEGETARALFARGRARLRLGDTPGALADHQKADRLRPGGKTKAGLAECYHQPDFRSPGAAAAHYAEAVRAGHAPAAVWHNLGWNLLQHGEKEKAQRALTRALDLDAKLGPAYLARMRVGIALGRGQPPESLREMVRDMTKALELLPATADLHCDAARACCLAGQPEQALGHVVRAIELGCDLGQLAADAHLRDTLGHLPGFADLRARPRGRPGPSARVLLDPLAGSLGID